MKPLIAALLSLTVLLSAGCSGRLESFSFQTGSGARIDIWQSPRAAHDRDALFQPTERLPSSPLYRLASPFTVAAQGQSFALTYSSDVRGCTLTLFSDKGKALKEATLPVTNGTPLRYLVALGRGQRIWGFQLSSTAGTGSLSMSAAGVAPLVHGFAIDGDSLVVDGSVEVLSASPQGASVRITEETRKEMQAGIWLVSLEPRDGARGEHVQLAGSDGETADFDVSPGAAPAKLDFARGSVAFLPRDVRVTGSIRGMNISQVPADAPLPADPGTILTWDRSSWRNPDFELFSWSGHPRVLILDIASYAVQDALLKRIAFFVEKAGHAGTVESLAALQGLHGYNAHDYRAEDLARFFTAAEKTAGGLSLEEKKLLSLLEDNGVVKKADSGYLPGDGAILSISRSSSPILRELLLVHECFHGIFFTLPDFRTAVEKEWASLPPVEQAVWETFLASRAYNTADHYLVVNEFQSYLMQQERAAVQGFQDISLSRLRASSTHAAGLVRQLLSTHPAAFLDQFDSLDKSLQAAGGPPGGLAVAVMKKE